MTTAVTKTSPTLSHTTSRLSARERRKNKPMIINWFQRKLSTAGPKHRTASQPTSSSSRTNAHHSPTPASPSEINLDESVYSDDDGQRRRSLWSQADDDASTRPLPPSSPPSPVPSSRASSSHPPTFRSTAASTKPTTLLSIDVQPDIMAHIAQSPSIPPSPQMARFAPPHIRSGSQAGSVSFSALPPSRPASLAPAPQTRNATTQAPLHTSHHPRNNPRPSSPPMDNASVLTLASSAFAAPAPSSHFAADEVLEDQDASVRALRPRSSRRGSWESEASRWSAKFARDKSMKSFRATIDDDGETATLESLAVEPSGAPFDDSTLTRDKRVVAEQVGEQGQNTR